MKKSTKNSNPSESATIQVAKLTYKQAIFVAIITAAAGIVVTLITTGATKCTDIETDSTKTSSFPPSQTNKDNKDNKKVILIGSGTVYKYLNEFGITKKLDENLGVQILEGPTETGAKIFESAFRDNNILVMSSKKLAFEDLKQPTFEIYLGADNLQMLLIAPKSDSLESTFGQILKVRKATLPYQLDLSINPQSEENELDSLEFKDLNSIENWYVNYKVYAGSQESATNKSWFTHLRYVDDNPKKWESAKFEVMNIQQVDEIHFDKPVIYLGRTILNDTLIKKFRTDMTYTQLNMLYDSKPTESGLYLYGFVNKNNSSDDNNFPGYKLPDEIKLVLNFILTELKSSAKSKSNPKSKMIDLVKDECIVSQIDFLHLNEEKSWISNKSEQEQVFRVKNCTGRPEEKKF